MASSREEGRVGERGACRPPLLTRGYGSRGEGQKPLKKCWHNTSMQACSNHPQGHDWAFCRACELDGKWLISSWALYNWTSNWIIALSLYKAYRCARTQLYRSNTFLWSNYFVSRFAMQLTCTKRYPFHARGEKVILLVRKQTES